MEAVRFDEAFQGLTYDAILDSGEDNAEAMDYARGMVWNEVELTDNYIKYANHVGSVNDVDVYYDYGADYYFFVPASEGIHESTRQTLGMWQDYDPEKEVNPDKREWETDPKILAYDKENRKLHKEQLDEVSTERHHEVITALVDVLAQDAVEQVEDGYATLDIAVSNLIHQAVADIKMRMPERVDHYVEYGAETPEFYYKS